MTTTTPARLFKETTNNPNKALGVLYLQKTTMSD